MFNKSTLLFAVILLEGYVVLASELLAIRQLIPFVGSGVEVISIIISGVLLPLAIGYHAGGRIQPRRESLRRRLRRNTLIALLILTFGQSFLILELFFTSLTSLVSSHLVHAAAYALIFLVTPIYLLGQTVPLVSNYFSRRRLSEITGRMLFFSTVGSFMGSVFSTLVLMNTIGVHYTAVVTLSLLFVLVVLLSRRALCYEVLVGATIMALLVFFNSPPVLRSLNIVSNNGYNLVQVDPNERPDKRIFYLNRSRASMRGDTYMSNFPYVNYIMDQFLLHSPRTLDALVIGAGGFTVGIDDDRNRYTYVDIDPDLRDVAQKHFLKRDIGPNKKFIPMSARAFTNNTRDTYDFILIDTYTNNFAIPIETLSREFLLDLKRMLKPEGVLVVNLVSFPAFQKPFDVRYDNTFRSVFPNFTRQAFGATSPWKKPVRNNVLYIYYNMPSIGDQTIYTDDKNTYSLDQY